MNSPNSEKDETNSENDEAGARAKTKAEAEQQRLAILGLFRLLETAVQTMQLKLGGQIVVPVQEIVGTMLTAKAEFDEHRLDAAVQGMREAAETFRHKTVRWESQARAAQAGQLPLTDAQKRLLASELPAVRTASRKTQLLFERLLSDIEAWALTAQPDMGESAAAPDSVAETEPVAENAGQDVLPQRVKVAYIPAEEGTRHVSESVDELAMMVRRQFGELSRLFPGAQHRAIVHPIQSALVAFGEGHYPTARSILDEAHQAFRQLVESNEFDHAKAAEEHFDALNQGMRKIEIAATQHIDELRIEQGATAEAEPEVTTDPIDDLSRLREIVENDLHKMFPPGAPREHRRTVEETIDLVVLDAADAFIENVQTLRHAINSGADIDAPETKEARAILKRLRKCRPEDLRPSHTIEFRNDVFAVAGESDDFFAMGGEDEADEDGITLNFSMPSTKRVRVNAVDIRAAGTLELTFRNSSRETAHLHAQMFNAAERPILDKPAAIQLPATGEKLVKGHIAGMADKIDRNTDDTQVVMVEFRDVPHEVEITGAAFK